MTPTDFSFFLPFFLLAVVFSLLQFVGMIFAIIDLLRREDY